MTRVDFYVLEDAAPQGRERLACRLADKAFRLGQPVYIHTRSRDHAAALDDLLWTFRAGSFVPHELYGAADAADSPVLIGHEDPPGHAHTLLINLADTVPSFFSRFERVLEMVDQNQDNKLAGRERFRFYRDRGYALHTHTLSAQAEDE